MASIADNQAKAAAEPDIEDGAGPLNNLVGPLLTDMYQVRAFTG